MKISSTEVINAPKDRVFDVFSDIEHAEERIGGIQKLDLLSDTRRGRGVRWRETRVMFGKEATEEMVMTDFHEPNSYVVEAQSHGMHYTSRYVFEEAEEGATTVRWEFEGTPMTVVARLMAPIGLLFKGATKKALESDVRDLKGYLES